MNGVKKVTIAVDVTENKLNRTHKTLSKTKQSQKKTLSVTEIEHQFKPLSLKSCITTKTFWFYIAIVSDNV